MRLCSHISKKKKKKCSITYSLEGIFLDSFPGLPNRHVAYMERKTLVVVPMQETARLFIAWSIVISANAL